MRVRAHRACTMMQLLLLLQPLLLKPVTRSAHCTPGPGFVAPQGTL